MIRKASVKIIDGFGGIDAVIDALYAHLPMATKFERKVYLCIAGYLDDLYSSRINYNHIAVRHQDLINFGYHLMITNKEQDPTGVFEVVAKVLLLKMEYAEKVRSINKDR